MEIRLCNYINRIIISLVYEDDDFVQAKSSPLPSKEENVDLMAIMKKTEKILALMMDTKDTIAELVADNRMIKKTVADMAKKITVLNKRIKAMEKAVAPTYIKLPLSEFIDEKSDQLVSDGGQLNWFKTKIEILFSVGNAQP